MHTVFLAVLLAVQSTSVPAVSASGPVGEAYFLFVEGKAAESRGDLAAAVEHYRQALTLVGDAADVRAELAGVYAQQGDLEGARREAALALTVAPGNRQAHRLLGLIAASSLEGLEPAVRTARVREAIDHLQQASDEAIEDPILTLTLADMLVRDGQHDSAIQRLQEFLLDRPGYPQAVMLLVQAYRANGQQDLAESVIREFRGDTLSSPAARLRAIESLESRGNWRQAAAAWERLVEEQPDEPAYRLRFAAALANAGEVIQARSELTALADERPDDIRPWYLLTQIEQRAGRSAEAEAAARRIIAIDPADGRGTVALARVLSGRQDFRGVVSALTARVEAPTDRDVETGMFGEMAALLARAHEDLGDGRRAVRTLEDARKRTPDDAELAFALAATYDREGQASRAERVFREIIGADPNHAAALNYLGYMLADRGRQLPEALGFIERAIAIAGENPAYLDSLGWAYFRMSRFDEAVGPLERAADGAPTASVILAHLGDAYMELERFDQATDAFERALSGDLDGIDRQTLTKKRDRARAASTRR